MNASGLSRQHHESGTTRRNNPGRAQRPRCVFQRNLAPDHPARRRGINISGVDFWHAVEFSRNGSFLRDHLTGPSGLSLRFLQLIRSFPTRFPLAGFTFRLSLSGVSNLTRFDFRFRSSFPALLAATTLPQFWTGELHPVRGRDESVVVGCLLKVPRRPVWPRRTALLIQRLGLR